jgi:hypothetical protein
MSGGELYCVEMFPGSSRDDSSTQKFGEPLRCYHTSQPSQLNDKTFCFWRVNQVQVCDPVPNSVESVASTQLNELAFASAVALKPGKVAIPASKNSKGSEPVKSILIVVKSTGCTCR